MTLGVLVVGSVFYLATARGKARTPIEVDVRGKLRPAEVRKKPLYSKDT